MEVFNGRIFKEEDSPKPSMIAVQGGQNRAHTRRKMGFVLPSIKPINILAEKAAWEEAKARGVDLVVVNPMLVIGPMMQSTVNASSVHILKYLTGATKTYTNAVQGYVHVRDVALAHILVYETPSASGRYICAESMLHRGEVVEILAKFFPEYPIPIKCKDEKNPREKPYKFSNKKIKDLGLEFTPVKECLYDTVKSCQEKGHLPIPTQQ